MPEPLLMQFVYDALGRRVETVEYVDAATGQPLDGEGGNPPPRRTRHVYFGLEQIQDYRYYDDDPPGFTGFVRLKQFVWGDPDRYPEQVGMIVGEPGVELAYHFLHDALGSVVGVVSNTGVLAERTTYDPYGKPYVESYDPQSETWNAQPTSITANPFGFTGHRYDAAVGLYHTLFRSYDPTLGRWLQRDPIEYGTGAINLYEYVLSAPLSWIDPLGLAARGESRKNRIFDPVRGGKTDFCHGLLDIDVQGDPSYIRRVEHQIEKLKRDDPFLKTMIEELDRSTNKHIIKMPGKKPTGESKGNSNKANSSKANKDLTAGKPGVGCGSETRFDPHSHHTAEDDSRNPRVGLAHELSHASDADKGERDPTPNPNTGVKKNEEKAVRVENLVRRRTGDETRTEYSRRKVENPTGAP